MLILSWNVAGLSTTVKRIHDNYQPRPGDSGVKPNKHPAAALQEYFSRHGATILCLQEHKIPKQQLTGRHEPRQCANVEKFDSFWSCCVDDKKKGLNGVVTYAAQGTVLAADPAPLGSPDLDQQGRCIMTDHGAFVLFNVYVPAGGGQPLSYKMKFLNALRRAMNHQRRNRNKRVILVGDLNICHTERDCFWSDRVIHVQDVLDEVNANNTKQQQADMPSWKMDLATHWSNIETVMQAATVVETQTVNSLTKEKYNKFRLAVTVDDRRVFLGSHETSEDYCQASYNFFKSRYYHDFDTDEDVLSQEENVFSISVLSELMAKIACVKWDEATQRLMARTTGTARRVSPTKQWLTAVLQEDGMVDAFRNFYPEAQARFTCWHQFHNQRYTNNGARIDYTLLDRSLLPHLQQGEVDSLRCCDGTEEESSLSESAALRAATANGRFQPASFEGGGIGDVSQEALDTQFGPPHTGMVYTPPSFSDHIGVSLLLDDTVLPHHDLVLDETDATTRKAQPHKLQKSIASFFSNSAFGNAKPKAAAKTLTNTNAIAASSLANGKRNVFPKNQTEKPAAKAASSKRLKPASATKKVAKSKTANSILRHFGKTES